jgi:hypothetical protein
MVLHLASRTRFRRAFLVADWVVAGDFFSVRDFRKKFVIFEKVRDFRKKVRDFRKCYSALVFAKVVCLNWAFPGDDRRHFSLFTFFRHDLKLSSQNFVWCVSESERSGTRASSRWISVLRWKTCLWASIWQHYVVFTCTV